MARLANPVRLEMLAAANCSFFLPAYVVASVPLNWAKPNLFLQIGIRL
jgi:hypothetical protein